MKKILMILAVTVILVAIGAGVCAGVQMSEADGITALTAAPTSDEPVGNTLEHAYAAEITYNNLSLPNGNIRRNLQIWIDIDGLCEGLSEGAAKFLQTKAYFAITDLKAQLEAAGYSVLTDENDDYFLEVVLGYFDDITDMYIAYGYTGYDADDNGNTVTEWGFFYNKVTHTMQSAFANIDGTIIMTSLNALTTIDGISNDNVELIYNYGTKYDDGTITSSANKVYYHKDLGIYIHKFSTSYEDKANEYTISQNVPNVLTWYLGALVLTAIPAAVFIIIAAKNSKANRKRS